MILNHDSDNLPDRHTLWDDSHGHPDVIGIRSLGFWLYMMSDAMIFAGLFTAHETYLDNFAGSFTAAQVLNPVQALLPTLMILASVLTYGLACVCLKDNNRSGVLRWMAVSLLLGLAFLGLEGWEFADLYARGAVPQKSGFLSDFWTLIWAHGLHVFFGLIWIIVMMIQVARDGFSELVVARMMNLRIFWFFQAIVWIFVFSFVYLMGAR